MVLSMENRFFRFFLSLVLCLGFVFSSVSVAYAGSTAEAENMLKLAVYNKLQDKEYALEGGGSIKGRNIMTSSGSNQAEFSEEAFTKLTSKAQKEFVADLASVCRSKVGENGVTEQTVQNWWKELQTKEGVGSKFMNEILSSAKPDFVSANKIFAPFNGIIGTVLGILAIAIMTFLGLVMVLDIAYITLPPIRLFVDDGNGGNGKTPISKLFSYDAINAVKTAEEGGDNKGGHAIGIYFKRRIVMLILLGICLLFLVQGQIYEVVGWILDLVSGFLGF